MNYIVRQYVAKLKSNITYKNFTYSKQMFSFKSVYSLENLYPKTNLSLYTPNFVPDDPSLKFNGYIPIKEIDITYSRSKGPGGQNINKLNTKVDVRFNVKNALWLSEEIKQKIIQKLQKNINKDGYLIVKSELTRSQQLNLADALQKLRKMIRDLIVVPRELPLLAQEKYIRRKMKAIQDRIFTKRIKSNIKTSRQDFTEMMRVLGYSRLISLSNFHYPNFPLVAEILLWLVKRFDNDANIPNDYNTEQERVDFIHYVAEFMIKTVNIRLSIKKLYMANTYAVKELLKMTSLLYKAQIQSTYHLLWSANQSTINFDISDRLNDLKTTKKLASQLTINGATLYDLLGREVELHEIRISKVNNQYDTSEIEVAIKEVIENTRKEIEETKIHIENVKDTEQTLDIRIERRKTELERNQKRLQTLCKVRPAFMEEFEKLEIESKYLYDDYLQKFRYLAYLEHLYEDAAKIEQERFERRQAATKKQLEQLHEDDVNIDSILDSHDLIFTTNLENSLTLGEGEKKSLETTNKDLRKSARINVCQRRLFGSMSGRQQGTIHEINGSIGSSDSDSDLLIDNIDDDDYDEDLLISVNPNINEFNSKLIEEKRALSKIDHTDDEF